MSSGMEKYLLDFFKTEIPQKEEAIRSLPKAELTKAWKLAQQLSVILSPQKEATGSECETKRKRGRPRKILTQAKDASLADNKDSQATGEYGKGATEKTKEENIARVSNLQQDLTCTGELASKPLAPCTDTTGKNCSGQIVGSSPNKRPQRKATGRFEEVLRAIKKEYEGDYNDIVGNDGKTLLGGNFSEQYNQNKEQSEVQTKHGRSNEVGWKTLPVANVVEISHQNVLSDHLLPPDINGMPFAKHVKGPTKLTQAEIEFYEKCRTSDRLGWRCPKCGRIVNNRANLKVHMRRHTGEKPYSCSLCEKTFAVKVNYTRHVNMHTQTFSCEMCGQVCGSEGLLHAHIKKKHKKGVKTTTMTYYCSICQRRFNSEGLWHRHLKASHGIEQQHECPQCQRTFDAELEMKSHIMSEHPSDKEGVDVRENPVTEADPSDTTTVTVVQVPDPKPARKWHCDTCGKTLSGQGSYLNHMAKHQETARFACQFCAASFHWKVSLKNHERRHTGEKPYRCEEASCEKTFRTATALARHRPVHGKGKQLKCSFCDKLFSYNLTLRRHVDAVHEKKSTECKVCHMKFTYPTNLWRHMKYHHTEKNSECALCHRKFALAYDLKKHMATHDSFRAFPCHLCSKRFKRQDLVTRHIKQHNGIPTYPCRNCDQKFLTRSQKDKHMRKCMTGTEVPTVEAAEGVCEQLGITAENIAGVRHLVVDPNSVQDMTTIVTESQGNEPADVCDVDMGQNGVQQSVLSLQSLSKTHSDSVLSVSTPAPEEGQTIILFVSDESQIPLDSVVIEEADFQQQFGNLISNSSELINYQVTENMVASHKDNAQVISLEEESDLPEAYVLSD